MLAHDRVDTVRADEQVATRLAAVGEVDRDIRVALLDRDAAGAEGEVRIAEGGAQRVVQVRAVQG